MRSLLVVALASGLGSAIGLIWIFAGMIRYGKFTVIEPCTPWLWCEMGLVVASAMLCLMGLIYEYRRMK